jgi:hypothetical protein
MLALRLWPVFLLTLTLFASAPLIAQEGIERRVAELEKRANDVQISVSQSPDHGVDGGFLFLCGAFCALWAQNTNRSSWLWFFLGLFFNVVTVLVLLAKNSADHDRERLRRQSTPM